MQVKQVIIIRKDLNMRRGKEIAQGAHASMAFLTKIYHKYIPGNRMGDDWFTYEEREWLIGNFTKVVLQAPHQNMMYDIYESTKNMGLTVNLIEDIGLTEFDGVKTLTAMAIGPHYEDKIDKITGPKGLFPLKLY